MPPRFRQEKPPSTTAAIRKAAAAAAAAPAPPPTPKKVTQCVYRRAPSKHFEGILGKIELHRVQMLLVGGCELITEVVPPTEKPLEWQAKSLQEQGMSLKTMWATQLPHPIHCIEVDLSDEDFAEYLQWKDITAEDRQSLVWRTFQVPCSEGTTKECLGLAVKAREITLGKNSPSLHELCNLLLAKP